MSVNDVRFRAEGDLVVLQVNSREITYPAYHGSNSPAKWRDASMEDLLDVAECLKRKYEDVRTEMAMDPMRVQIGGMS